MKLPPNCERLEARWLEKRKGYSLGASRLKSEAQFLNTKSIWGVVCIRKECKSVYSFGTFSLLIMELLDYFPGHRRH